jgi:hypothetical protein
MSGKKHIHKISKSVTKKIDKGKKKDKSKDKTMKGKNKSKTMKDKTKEKSKTKNQKKKKSSKKTKSLSETNQTKTVSKTKSSFFLRDDDIDDNEIEHIAEKFVLLKDNELDTKKVQQYKEYLKNTKIHVNELFNNLKYKEIIDFINKELKKTEDSYLRNELLKISEEIKFEYYKNPEHFKLISDKSGTIDENIMSYPTYYDPEFSKKIFKKAEFYHNKLEKVLPRDVDKIIKERKSGVISLAQHQRFLKNFMSRNTPYNSLLIFHGLGVGKTCASIAIAETLRPAVLANNQKIVIIAKPNFDKGEIFSMDRLKKGQNQCAGDTFVSELKNPELVDRCKEGHEESCKIVKHKIDKMVKNSYTFYGALEWAKHVLRDIQKATRGVPESKLKEAEIARIKKMYSNTLLIIDEAHNIKDASEKKSRIVPPVLMKVLQYADNLRLVLLSGTPMFNEPADLISILNYLLINDKRPILKENDIFRGDGTFTETGKETLINYSRGYVSFLRSENPINFPLRFSSNINGDHDLITPSIYPKRDIYGNKLEKGIQHLEIVGCPMGPSQEKIYKGYLEKRIIPDEEKTSAAYSSELQILNFIYQDLDKTDNLAETYGEKGLNSVMNKIGNKQQYAFNNPDDALEYKGHALMKHSSKIFKIMENIEKAKGLVFVYTEYEISGVLPLVFALELAGYKKYKSSDSPILMSEHKDRKYKGDYLIISGNAALSKHYESYLAKRHEMINEPVKIILATRAASEGINLFGVREIHVLNPWHNLNRLSQAIGRGLRSWSHIELPPEERNITVYLYAATFNPKGSNHDQETIDLKIYREAENKAINIGLAEDILRRNAIDCPLNIDGNHYSQKDWGEKIEIRTSRGELKKVSVYDQPYSHVCHYLKNCDYKCFNPPPKFELKNDELDYSTYNLSSFKYEIKELSEVIAKLFKTDVIMTLDTIVNKIPSKYSKDINIIYKALQDMVDNKVQVNDKFGRHGYLIYKGKYYIFQPLQINNPNLLVYQRSIPPPIIPNMVDISEYVNKLGDYKKELLKKDVFKETEVIDLIIAQFENIKIKSNDAIFTTSFDLSDHEMYQIIMDRLIPSYKRILLNYLLLKEINNISLSQLDKSLLKCLDNNIIRKGYIERSNDNTIYGYRLIENDKQTFYKYQVNENTFEFDTGIQLQILDLQKINYSRSDMMNYNQFYGYLKFDKSDQPALFKIRDLTKGDKKSIKGITCVYKSRKEIYDHLKSVYPNAKDISNKKMMCDDIEIIMRRNDIARKGGKRWFYSAEEAKEFEDLTGSI